MRHRFYASAILIALISFPAFAQKKWTPPKTAWGNPDLQGTWTSTTTTPFERSPQYGNRLFLTEEEYKQSEKQLERQLAVDGEDSDSPNARASTGPPDHWTERASRASRQTSLVVEPADGRVPGGRRS